MYLTHLRNIQTVNPDVFPENVSKNIQKTNNFAKLSIYDLIKEIRNIAPWITNDDISILRIQFPHAMHIFYHLIQPLTYYNQAIIRCREQNYLFYSITNAYGGITRFLIKLYVMMPGIVSVVQITQCIFTSILLKQTAITNILMMTFLNKKDKIDKIIYKNLVNICMNGNIQEFNILLKIDNYYPIPFDYDNYRALFIAVECNRFEIVKLIFNILRIFNNMSLTILYKLEDVAEMLGYDELSLLLMEIETYKLATPIN